MELNTSNKISKNHNFIEVFCGCGGLSLGLKKSGFIPLLDNNKDCIETLKLNNKTYSANIICDDIKNIDFKKYNNIDLLAGGIPCQSFSIAGKRKGLDDCRGNLFFDFIDAIKQCNPKIFLIENVHGLITHNGGETFKYILKELELDFSYKVYYKLLNANDYNVPQKRKRVFIIGLNQSYFKNKEYIFPEPESYKPILNDVLPISTFSINHKYYEYNKEKKRLFSMLKQGECWINLPIDEQKKYLGNMYNSKGGKHGILRKLSLDKPCLTILCSPSQKQTERCHPIENRPLSIQESAAIQTFTPEYLFYGSLHSIYRQIGNAVPVNLAYFIGKSIFNLF
jgi:DNA (cytosine-5)-methyltransferase 1